MIKGPRPSLIITIAFYFCWVITKKIGLRSEGEVQREIKEVLFNKKNNTQPETEYELT